MARSMPNPKKTPSHVSGKDGDIPFHMFMYENPNYVPVTLIIPSTDEGFNQITAMVLKYDLVYVMQAATTDAMRITFYCKDKDTALLFRLSV